MIFSVENTTLSTGVNETNMVSNLVELTLWGGAVGQINKLVT